MAMAGAGDCTMCCDAYEEKRREVKPLVITCLTLSQSSRVTGLVLVRVSGTMCDWYGIHVMSHSWFILITQSLREGKTSFEHSHHRN